ncbi:MAG: DUF1820 family protein [Pseudomonadota bacterium]
MSSLYRVSFVNQGQVYEVYARSVGQGDLFGFLEISELKFGERTTVVVDPTEERIKSEFAGVKKSYIPMHAVLRIDAVEEQGQSKITKLDSANVTPFPVPTYSPSSGDS